MPSVSLPHCHANKGIADFAPQQISGGGFFKRPKFEDFNEVIDRASCWLSQNSDLNFCNAQSIDIKLKSCKLLARREIELLAGRSKPVRNHDRKLSSIKTITGLLYYG